METGRAAHGVQGGSCPPGFPAGRGSGAPDEWLAFRARVVGKCAVLKHPSPEPHGEWRLPAAALRLGGHPGGMWVLLPLPGHRLLVAGVACAASWLFLSCSHFLKLW